ncbi:MAG: MotA/TolQ/ExbB proton channel family protein [Opitutae bacterium]|nr:MotA/TolQ/ExbB proton channel family protein [Opitutae bacterium]
MTPLIELAEKGGPVMLAIVALSVVLYARCFGLLFSLRRERRQLRHGAGLAPAEVQRRRADLHESFRHQRLVLSAMIAAAPLLGLLGTVSGMVKTFESLSADANGKSMEGLARGISEVLVATESGLLVALPALLLVYLAHREVLAQDKLLSLTGGTR